MADLLIPYQFDPKTVDLLLEGLDALPHGRVRGTYDAIRDHAYNYAQELKRKADAEAKAARAKKRTKTQEPT